MLAAYGCCVDGESTVAEVAGRATELLLRLQAEGRPNRADALRFAKQGIRGRVSKFEACVPEALLLELWAYSLLDEEGARAALIPYPPN